MTRKGVFRQSTTDSVHTPEYILKYIRKHWGENLYDPCPFNPEFDPKIHQDGLKTKWKSPAFVNPPFSRNKKFIQRGYKLWKEERIVSIFLLKVGIVGSKYFADYFDECEIRLFTHRIKFPEYDKPAPFPCMLLIYDGKNPGKISIMHDCCP